MKKLFWAAAITNLLAAPLAQADTLYGIYAGLDGWDMGSSGRFGSGAAGNMTNFSLDGKNKVSYFLAIEHPIPILPNFRIRGNDLSTSGDVNLSVDFEFGDQSFTTDSTVATDFDFQSTDFTLYYEIFDNDVLSFDLGLTGKYLDGEITVTEETTLDTATESFKGVVPMIYGALEVGVPATGFSFFGELNALSINDHMIQDYQAGLAYSFIDNLAIDLSVRAGYREFSVELDGLDEIYTDWSFDGPFLGIEAHF